MNFHTTTILFEKINWNFNYVYTSKQSNQTTWAELHGKIT